MGVLNVTPDSFYDGGRFLKLQDALNQAEKLIKEGCDIIDVGGESTRPGSEPIPLDEELRRVIPVIEEIKKKFPEIIISIDTTKSKVAEESIKRGAEIVNDISGLQFDFDMVKIVTSYNVYIIIMHIKRTPKTMQENPTYDDVIMELKKYFSERIDYAIKNGVDSKKIWIDPGIGFGKTVQHNITILKNLDKFKEFNKPIVIGCSRKSFIGKILDDLNPPPAEERLAGTISSNIIAYTKGATIFRVHDARENINALKVASVCLKE